MILIHGWVMYKNYNDFLVIYIIISCSVPRGSQGLIEGVLISSGWLGGSEGRDALIWGLTLTLNSPSSPTTPRYVVGDIAGCV